MKKLFTALMALIILGCTPKMNDLATSLPVNATIDLVNVTDDKVKVEIDPGRLTSESINFYIPKTVPGTYSDDNYGQNIVDFTALDYNNKPLEVSKLDENSWKINNAVNLDKVTYYVNDTFDSETEKESPVFSPAGSNIDNG
jgi:predicted metalloprotease with PDZ domain